MSSIMFNLGAGSTMTVTAHPTATPGLVVHDQGPFGNDWSLTHHKSGALLGEFTAHDGAQAAAAALNGVADWEGPPEGLQDESVIWKTIDAVEAAGGVFKARSGGLGEQVAAKRRAALADASVPRPESGQ